jgi:hypothetical protein
MQICGVDEAESLHVRCVLRSNYCYVLLDSGLTGFKRLA